MATSATPTTAMPDAAHLPDHQAITRLVHAFYGRARGDALLGPVFEATVQDWTTHLDTLVAFWSSVLLRSGTYRGNPMSAHRPLDLNEAHFERWLALWSETARESLTPPEAAHVSALAQRIGQSLRIGLGIDPLRRERRAGGAPACMNGDAGGSADQPA